MYYSMSPSCHPSWLIFSMFEQSLLRKIDKLKMVVLRIENLHFYFCFYVVADM